MQPWALGTMYGHQNVLSHAPLLIVTPHNVWPIGMRSYSSPCTCTNVELLTVSRNVHSIQRPQPKLVVHSDRTSQKLAKPSQPPTVYCPRACICVSLMTSQCRSCCRCPDVYMCRARVHVPLHACMHCSPPPPLSWAPSVATKRCFCGARELLSGAGILQGERY